MRALIVGLALVMAGCGPVRTYAEDMPDSLIEAAITVKGDALDGYRVADSSGVREPFYQYQVTSDLYVRAFRFDDGKSTVQLIVTIDHTVDWPRPYQINFGSPLRSVKLERADIDVDCYGARNCHHREAAIANLSQQDVETMLGDAMPDPFEIRIKTALGDIDRTMRKTEIMAVMRAVGLEAEASKQPPA